MAEQQKRADEEGRRPGEGRPDMNDINEEQIRGRGDEVRGLAEDEEEEFEEDEDLEEEEDEGTF